MREILFRGKHTVYGTWVEGCLVKKADSVYEDMELSFIPYHEDDAHAFYLCRRCRMLVEKSRYRRMRTDRCEESN